MKLGLTVGLMLLSAFLAAQSAVPAEERFNALLAERAEQRFGELTVHDAATVMALLSVARQERAHIERSGRLSWAVPGLGHFINGARSEAITFAAADLAVGLATVLIATQLLPAAVRHRNLNYLQNSFATIRSRWMTVTPSELIPAFATIGTGAMVGLTLRFVAAASARESGLEALRRGTITFDPTPLEVPDLSPSSATPRSYSSSGGSLRR